MLLSYPEFSLTFFKTHITLLNCLICLPAGIGLAKQAYGWLRIYQIYDWTNIHIDTVTQYLYLEMFLRRSHSTALFKISAPLLRNLSHHCYGRVNYAPHAMPHATFVRVSKTLPETKSIVLDLGASRRWGLGSIIIRLIIERMFV